MSKTHSTRITREKRKGNNGRTIPGLPKIMFTNAQSMKKKSKSLNLAVTMDGPDLCLLTETWLDGKDPDNLYQLQGYCLFRKDRKSVQGKEKGGGVCVYVKEDWFITANYSKITIPDGAEIISLQIRPKLMPREFTTLYFVGCYVNPEQKVQKEQVKALNEHIHDIISRAPEALVIVAGDFNRCKMKWLTNMDFYQHVRFATRKRAKLDLLFTNAKDAYECVKKAPLVSSKGTLSDHAVVCAYPKYVCDAQKPPDYMTITKRCKNAIPIMQDALRQTNWYTLFVPTEGVENNAAVLTGYIQHLLQMPEITRRCRIKKRVNKQWFNNRCMQLQKARHASYREGNLFLNKVLGKRMAAECKIAKREYLEKLTRRLKNETKAQFRIVNETIGKDQRNSSESQKDRIPELAGKSDYECAEILNQFYNRFSEGIADISELHFDLDQCPEFNPPLYTEEEIEKVLRATNVKKPAGPDNVPGWVIKFCAKQLARPVAWLFNKSLATGEVPSIWKIGSIKPIPKVRFCERLKDLRPITITSILGKGLQRIFKRSFDEYQRPHRDPLQFGFTEGKSTTDALIEIWDFIIRGLEQEKTAVFATFMDFSSAFDSVSQEAFIQTLIENRMPRWIVKWMISFLSDTVHEVCFGDSKSGRLKTTAGFLQGNTMSSPAFNADTDTIRLNTPHAIFPKFADDSSEEELIKSDVDFNRYMEHLNSIATQAAEKGLMLNPDKCKEIRFDFTERNLAAELPPTLVNGKEVEKVSEIKLLGLWLSGDCKWSRHVEEAEKKANFLIKNLHRIRQSGLPVSFAKQYVESCLYPVLTYGAPVFHLALQEKDREVFRKIDKRVERALGVPSISFEERCENITKNHYLQAVKHGDKHFQQRQHPYNLRKKSLSVPRASTVRYESSFRVAAHRKYGQLISATS